MTTTQTNGHSSASNVVTADLFYFTPPSDGSKPVRYLTKPPEGVPVTNHENVKREAKVENVRGKEKDYTLDSTGFQYLLNVPSKVKRFGDDEEVKKDYYSESEELLKRVTGAARVLIFDHSEFRSLVVSCIELIN